MSSLRVVGCRLWDTGEPTEIVISAGLIGSVDESYDELDASGLIAAPGLVDLQVNGGFGYDFTSNPAAIWEVGSRLPEHGVTAFLPTVISSDPATVAAAQATLRTGAPDEWVGAIPLGLHCEGPMIAPQQRGTHPARFLVEPGLGLVGRWGGLDGLGMVTLAPELPGAEPVVRRLIEAGVVVAAGHSEADFATAVTSFEWGIRHGTHLFNAMSGFDHRQPGLAAALLATPSVTAGIIADGVHVHPGAVNVAYRAKAASGIALVTDAMAGLGMGEGTYPLGDLEVAVDANRAVNREGQLAGSVLTMDEAIRNFRSFTGCSIADAISSASVTPASILKDTTRGRLTNGSRADITFFDNSLLVAMTVVGGRVVFDRDGRSS